MLILLANSPGASKVRGDRLARPPSLPSLRPIDHGEEFANSIRCYSRAEVTREDLFRLRDDVNRLLRWLDAAGRD